MRVVLAGDYVCRGYNPPRGAKKTISGDTVLIFFVHDYRIHVLEIFIHRSQAVFDEFSHPRLV